ncbi:MAG: hypothetical protein ACRYGK_12825, partial [Janthinobacterium lividum]
MFASAQAQRPPAALTLGEVAGLASSDLGVLRRMMALALPWVPATGHTLRLDRATLQRHIHAQPGQQDLHMDWHGATAMDIVGAAGNVPSPEYRPISTGMQPGASAPPGVQEVSGETMVALARAAVGDWLQAQQQSAGIEVLDTPVNVGVPAGRLSLSVRGLPSNPPRERMTVFIDLRSGHHFVRSVPVRMLLNLGNGVAEKWRHEMQRAAASMPGDPARSATAVAEPMVSVSKTPSRIQILNADQAASMFAPASDVAAIGCRSPICDPMPGAEQLRTPPLPASDSSSHQSLAPHGKTR